MNCLEIFDYKKYKKQNYISPNKNNVLRSIKANIRNYNYLTNTEKEYLLHEASDFQKFEIIILYDSCLRILLKNMIYMIDEETEDLTENAELKKKIIARMSGMESELTSSTQPSSPNTPPTAKFGGDTPTSQTHIFPISEKSHKKTHPITGTEFQPPPTPFPKALDPILPSLDKHSSITNPFRRKPSMMSNYSDKSI